MQRVVQAQDIAEKLKPSLSSLVYLCKPNGYGRRFLSHVDIPEKISNEIFSRFGLTRAKKEPVYGNFLGNHYLDGASVHPHTDPAPDGYHHVRCNIALELPEEGGMPILDGTETKLSTGDAWICFASIETHSSTPIKGGERLIISIGALVDQKEASLAYVKIKNLN